MRVSARASWIAPTLHLVPWSAIGGAAAAGAVTGGLAHAAPGADLVSGLAVPFVVAAFAATAVLALDDPAHVLLAPLPVSRRRRVAQRLGLTLPLVLAAWLAVGAPALSVAGPVVDRGAPVLALAVLGCAAGTVVGTGRPERSVAAGLVAVGAVVATGAGLLTTDEQVQRAARVWLTAPWSTTAVALTVLVIAGTDPVSRWRDRSRRRPAIRQ